MKIFLLSLFLLQSLMLAACDRWQHVFGGKDEDAVAKIISAKNGGWVTAGYTSSYGELGLNVFIVKWNNEGEIEWQKVIGNSGDDVGYAVAQDSAGNIFVAGKTNSPGSVGGFDMYLLKLDSTGNLIWQNTYGGPSDDYATSLILDSAGGILMAGATTSFGAGGSDFYLVKVNSSGSFIWSKTFGEAGDEIIKGAALVNDGGFILAGSTSSFAGNRGYVIRTTNLGDSLWAKSYNLGQYNFAFINDVKILSDTEFIYTGRGSNGISSYGNMFHMKTDISGNLIYIQFSTNLSDIGFSIVATSDSGYAIAGVYDNYGGFPILTKYTSLGIKQWEHIVEYNLSFTYYSFAMGTSLVQNTDDSYTIGGSARLNGLCMFNVNNRDALIIKTDSAGFSIPTLSESIVANSGTNFCDSASVSVTLIAPAGYKSYQWFYDFECENKIIGANSQTYNANKAGVYFCLLISEESIYYSNLIHVTVSAISTPPLLTPSGIVYDCFLPNPSYGKLRTPFVEGFNYQWLLNGVAIAGATDYKYNPIVDGLYSVTVFDNCDTATSVQTEFYLNHGPQDVSISASGPTVECIRCMQNTILRSSDTNYNSEHTWLLNNTPILSTANELHILPRVSGNYSLIVSNACGIDTSNIITVLVDSNPVPVISSSGHSNLTVFSASGSNIYCGIDTLYCSPYLYCGTYEWRLNGNILPVTSRRCLAQQPGVYTAKIIDSCGASTLSQPFVVNALPGNDSIIVTNDNMCNYALLWAPTTTNNNSYQWFWNSTPLSNSLRRLSVTSAGNYYCTFQPEMCPMSIPTDTVSLNASIGYFGISASPSSSVCSGNILLSVSAANAFYVWKLNGSVISGATSQTYSASQTGFYTCVVSRPGCFQDSIYINIVIGTNQIVANHLFICPNTSTGIHLLVNDFASSFQWRRNSVDIVNDTNFFINANQPGTYDLRITGTCGTYITNSVTLTSLPTTLTPSGVLPVCNDSVVTIFAPTGLGYKYDWTIGIFSILDDTSATLSLSTLEYCCGTKYVKAYITIPGVCSYYTSVDTLLFQSNILNNIYSSTSTDWCINGNVQLNAREFPGLTYQWFRDSMPILSAVNSSYVSSFSGNYYVSIEDSTGCVNNSNSIFVNANHIEGSISVLGCQALCEGDSVQLSLLSSANTYQWSFNGDSIIGATTQDIIVDSTGIYSSSFSNALGCTGVASTNIFVSPKVHNSLVSNGQNFCIGDTAILRSSFYSNNVQWFINGNLLTGQTNYQCAVTQSGLYSQIDYANDCPIYSDTIALNFSSIPYANITSTYTSLCLAPSIMLLANGGVNLSYQWKKNGVPISGATFINYFASSSGIYTCEVTSNCGTTISNPIIITSSFSASISASGPTSFCSGSSVLLSSQPSSGTYFYQWKEDNMIIPGANSSTFTVSASGNYSVEISDINGCYNNSNVVTVVAISNSPSPNLTSSSGYLCPGQNVIISVDSANVNTCQWKHNGVDIAGAVAPIYAATAAGMYTCGVTNNCGSGISDSVYVTLASLPVVNLNSDTVLCLGASITLNAGFTSYNSYLWHDGSTSEFFTLTSSVPDSNIVFVIVTNSSGCVNSDSVLVVFDVCNGLNSAFPNAACYVYPNPASDKLNLFVLKENDFILDIIDFTGRHIYTKKVFENSTEINISQLAAGVYFLQISTTTKSILMKFVKN